MFRRVAVIGCGLIGGSFAAALRAAGTVDEVVAFDRSPDTARRAVVLGIADRSEQRVVAAIDGADLVVVAVPVRATADVFATLAAHLGPDAIVTDVGSTKGNVVAAARATLGDALDRFVPGHPIAGREVHGPDAARADLFRGRRVLLTPIAETNADAITRVVAAWTSCGARVHRIEVEAHDAVLSSVSHLPHLLAYALVAEIADADDAALKFALAGAGFRDFTRIAASDPVMWRDIALANRDCLLDDLDAYRARLDRLRAMLTRSDADGLDALFGQASEARTAWSEDR
jgi:prephenate dehydrogenase